MAIKVNMPDGGDERINPATVLVLRDATPSERRENPQVRTTIWTGTVKVYPVESLGALRSKFAEVVKLGELTAPNGSTLLVGLERVLDVDDPGAGEAKATKSVLFFGPGRPAPRQAVRETRDELRAVWTAAGISGEVLD